MDLSKLDKIKGTIRDGKRRGRGYGSGRGGHTSGRGTKGQNSRSGHKFTTGFEGGQVPLYKRLPQMGGFRNPTRRDIISLNLSRLGVFDDGAVVSPNTLLEKGIIKRLPRFGVKLLAKGKFSKKLILNGFLYSEAALEQAKNSGSKVPAVK